VSTLRKIDYFVVWDIVRLTAGLCQCESYGGVQYERSEAIRMSWLRDLRMVDDVPSNRTPTVCSERGSDALASTRSVAKLE
jgi:hypothetical protein